MAIAPSREQPRAGAEDRPTLGKLTGIFLKIGNTTFGGGVPTIAALEREFVSRRGWLSEEDFALAFSLCRVTPGTNIIAFCAATGARIFGLAGALSGVLSETLPSAVLAVLITQGYETWRTNPWVLAGISGTIAAVAGMMWASIWSLARPSFGGWHRSLRALVILTGAFLGIWKFGLTPVPIIGLAALVGVLWEEPAKS
jgi:chromate transporter